MYLTKSSKMMERFSVVAGRNFAELEVNVVKLLLQDDLVLEFRKVAAFLHKSRQQTETAANKRS